MRKGCDEDGTVTATAPKGAKPGDYVKVPVTVTPEGGEPYTVYSVFTVTETATPEKPDTVPFYPPVVIEVTDKATIPVAQGHTDGNSYELGAVPEGWTASIDPATGELQVTPPEGAKPGGQAIIPVTVTTPSGNNYQILSVVAVKMSGDVSAPDPDPNADGSSSEVIHRCFANAFALNSPILWMLPVAILAAIGGPLAQALQPQIDAASAQINAMMAEHRETFDRANRNRDHGDRGIFGREGRRDERPEWMRQAEAQPNAQINALNQRFAPIGEQLKPLGYALGALGLVALASSLIAQACQPEGFDHGMTIFGSSKDGEVAPGSSEKGAIHDAIMNGSSDNSKNSGSSENLEKPSS